MRWDYSVHPHHELAYAVVRVIFKGRVAWCRPVDWGPNVRTGRLIDISPGAALILGCQTDDVVGVQYST